VTETLPVRMNVQHDDITLRRDGSGALMARLQQCVMGAIPEVPWDLAGRVFALPCERIGKDHGALTARVLDVLYPDWDPRADHLLHGEWVDDLGAVVREFCCLLGSDDRDQAGRDDFAGVGGEDSVHFLPHLKFVRIKAYGEKRRTKISVAPADRGKQASRHHSEVSSDNR